MKEKILDFLKSLFGGIKYDTEIAHQRQKEVYERAQVESQCKDAEEKLRKEALQKRIAIIEENLRKEKRLKEIECRNNPDNKRAFNDWIEDSKRRVRFKDAYESS